MTTALQLDTWEQGDSVVVLPRGPLDVGTCPRLRDHLLKVGTDNPRAVIVDLAALAIEGPAALAVFPVVHTRLQQWPGVPLLLVAPGDGRTRELLARNRTARFLPVHDTISAAVAASDDPPPRRVSRLNLPNALTSPRLARQFARSTCATWNIDDLADDAALLIGELVSNAVMHTSAAPMVRLELRRGLLSVAVYDDLPGEVSVRDPGGSAGGVHGLLLVAQLATAWGCAPTADGGKVVWATLRTR
jgi:anti-anti-sigma regulatory factor